MLVYILDKNVIHIPVKYFSQTPSYMYLNLGTSKTLEYHSVFQLNILTFKESEGYYLYGKVSTAR